MGLVAGGTLLQCNNRKLPVSTFFYCTGCNSAHLHLLQKQLRKQQPAHLQYQLSEREPGSLGEPHSAMFSCANAPVNMPMGCGEG